MERLNLDITKSFYETYPFLTYFTLLNTLGIIGTILTSISYFPQVIKIIRTREVEALSYAHESINCIDALVWIIYGYFINSIEVVASYSIIAICSFIVIILKFIHTRKERVIPLPSVETVIEFTM